MSRVIRLPSPTPKYDRDNEAALRRALEQLLSENIPAQKLVRPTGDAGDLWDILAANGLVVAP